LGGKRKSLKILYQKPNTLIKMNNEQTIDDLLAKYLADETDTHESDTISEWIIASEDNQKTFDHSKIIWDGAKNQQKVDVDAAWTKLNISKKKETEFIDNQKSKPAIKLNWGSNFLKIAAVLVVLFGLWFVAAKQFIIPKNDVLTFKSGNQAIEKILPDGTKILLSENSEITYPKSFEGDTREINLTGEGFFDVHHDAAHPFIIHTQGTDVRVLGTSFNVRAYNAQVQVLVKTGRVQFSKNKNQVILIKGEKGEILANVDTIIKSEIAEVETVIKDKLNSFVFNKMSLGEVADALSKQFGKDIKFSQDKIKNCKLTATFENENLENIIAVIAETFNLKVDNQVDTIILSGEGCE
jgi:transmembrane sensor